MCEQNLPISDFRYSKSKNRHETYCKSCQRKYLKRYRVKKRNGYVPKGKYGNIKRNDPRYGRHWWLMTQYNLTFFEYEKIHKEQNGKCAICDKHESELDRILLVDHNHKTKEIRGLLCNSCNTLLGYLKDDPELIERVLKSAKAYLGREPIKRLPPK